MVRRHLHHGDAVLDEQPARCTRLCHHHRPYLDSIRVRAAAGDGLHHDLPDPVLPEAQPRIGIRLPGAPVWSKRPHHALRHLPAPACLRDGRHRVRNLHRAAEHHRHSLRAVRPDSRCGDRRVRHARRNGCGRDLRRDSDGDPVPGNRPLCGLQRLGCWRRVRGLHQLRIPRQHRRYRILCGPAGRRLQRHRSHRRYAVRILADAARRSVSLRVLLRHRPDTGAARALLKGHRRHQPLVDAERHDALPAGRHILLPGCVYRRIHRQEPRLPAPLERRRLAQLQPGCAEVRDIRPAPRCDWARDGGAVLGCDVVSGLDHQLPLSGDHQGPL